jgi:hypothetical protein
MATKHWVIARCGGRSAAAKVSGVTSTSDASLRDWAWAGGWTDVILELDVAAAVRAYLSSGAWANVVTLSNLASPTVLSPATLATLQRLAATGGPATDCTALHQPLSDWLAVHERRLAQHGRAAMGWPPFPD